LEEGGGEGLKKRGRRVKVLAYREGESRIRYGME